MIRLLLAFAGICAGLLAQDGASLAGQIRDAQGKVVASAQIRLFRQDTGDAMRTASDVRGEYLFERLAPAGYLLEVEKENFRGTAVAVQVERDTHKSLDVAMEVAGVSQSVVVTAAGAPQRLDEISKAVTVVSGEEIQSRNEYALSEILRTTPGVTIQNAGGPGQNTSIRIRGLRADATAVLVDGLRFRDAATTQSDASSMVSALNFISADRVEVLRGSGSSLYGTNAVGGVVNVVTQEGGRPLHGQLQAEAGNLGLYRGRGSVGGGLFGDRLKYSGGFLHLNVTNGVDGNDANRSTGGQTFVRYDLTPRTTISGRLWASDDFVQTNISPTTSGIPMANLPLTGIIPAIPLAPAGVATINAGGTPDYGTATFVPGRDDPDYRRSSRLYTAAFIFRQSLSARSSWQTSYQRVHTNRVYQDGPGGGGYQPETSNFSEYIGDIDTVDVRGTAQIAPWISLTGGYEFEREDYFDAQRNNLPAPQTLSTRTSVHQDAHAGYFATQIALLGRRLQISLSGRAQAFRLSRPEFAFTGSDESYSRIQISAPPKALTGDAAVAYLIGRTNTKLRAHFGNAYRAPSLYERFGAGFYTDYITGATIFTPYGDPRLAPDRYNSVDAGVDQYLFGTRLRLSATLFYSRVVSLSAFDSSGVIDAATDPYGRYSGYINGSGGISRGVELAGEARPFRTLTLSGSYTYTNAAQDRDITVPQFYRVLNIPRHAATFVATKSWSKRVDTTLDFYKSSHYYTAFYAGSGSRAFEFPGFFKADVGGSYRFWDSERRSARIYGKVDNVFNRRYYQNGWLAPRATFVMGLGYAF